MPHRPTSDDAPGPARSRVGRVLDLTGPGWLVREALGDTWQWYVDAPVAARNNAADAALAAAAAPGWWPATVPGSVVTDLARAGELPDPYLDRNSRAAEWTGARHWVYRRGVDLPALGSGERAVLELDGVDPSGTVLWDGEPLGRVEGLYHRFRAEVPAAAATPGVHRLAVVVDPVPPNEPQVGRTERVRVHRPRMTEGWDFCPRLPHQGLWRPARVVIDRVHLAEVTVRADLLVAEVVDGRDGLAEFGAPRRVRWSQAPNSAGTTEATAGVAPGDGVVRVRGAVEVGDGGEAAVDVEVLDSSGAVVAARRVDLPGALDAPGALGAPGAPSPRLPGAPAARPFDVTLRVPAPDLWWPRRLGTPTTYAVRLAVAGGGRELWRGATGFRTARMVPNAGAPDDARGYTAEVNGVRLPLVGWNWAPADAQYGTITHDRVEHLVGLAAASDSAVLRVWGGGLVETEEFYDACDRAGLLVWQELSQSSSGMQSAPSEDPAFVDLMRREAAVVVPPRTHHPSLLVWGGGNELDLDGVPLDEDRSPVLAALRDEVARLEPGRAWLPTSPTGPAFHHRADVIAAAPDDQHDVHGPWEHQGLTGQHALADAGTCLAHSEFGVEGMANRRLLDHLVPADRAWPLDRSNPVHRHLGEWWDNAPLVQQCFAGRLADVDGYRRASQHLQATGLAYAVEADRRRWPRCSLVLPWQLAESYPNTWCTAVVDHLGDPKPAFHAVARAFAPDRATLRTATTAWGGRAHAAAEVWLWSDAGVPAGSDVVARLRTADGDVLGERRWAVPDAVREPRPVGDLRHPATALPRAAVLLWEVAWTAADGERLDHEVVVATSAADLAPLLDLAPATVDVAVRPDGPDAALVEVAHRAGPAVVGLALLDARPAGAPGWAVLDGDPRPLLPGATRTLRARWTAPTRDRRLVLEAWNLPTADLAPPVPALRIPQEARP
ncbi:glycosyl hydrolase 2 galactose-binding domain-containing protein [Cellulomonas sp. Y8]|uniref:glycosyl hydrolase 2 galactose-binding domain-containing protein n=1 Tax=Cellulomonas sp. Y8 TaxID=2591145 RepID=UPI003D743D23